jgi:hypothetical protein
VPRYVSHRLQGNSDVMTRGEHGLQVKSTVFSPYWVPQDRDVLDQGLQDLVDATTMHKTFDLGHGIRLHCANSILGFGMVFGCTGDPPAPPSAKSGDSRLSMAPAKPLVSGLGKSDHVHDVPAAAASVFSLSSPNAARCETGRVAGAPPAPDCPQQPTARSGPYPALWGQNRDG